MRKSKIVLIFISALLIMVFVAGSVQAQDPPPVWDGEMPDISEFTPRVDEDAFPTGEVGVDGGGGNLVAPVSPAFETVYTKTPKFYFTRDYRADRYEIQLYDINNSVTLYSFKGAGTCNSGYCYLQPTTKLQYSDIFGSGGAYDWSVRARINGSWEPTFSNWVSFGVLSPGFTSTFDGDMNKWNEVIGTWTLKNGALKANGIAYYYSSVFHRDIFDDFDYTVVMKRKNNLNNTSGVIIGGYPYPLDVAGEWDDGLYFVYTNSGSWYVWGYDEGSFTYYVAGMTSSAIKPFDWNTLRVVHRDPYVDLWINGTYLGWLNVPGFYKGVVGIDMYRYILDKEPLLVDSATLTTIVYPPFTEHDPAMQLGLEPIEVDKDPNRLLLLPAEENPTGTR